MTIVTNRLNLRPWNESDFKPFAQLNADARVMEYFPTTLSREESDQMINRMQAKIEERGWGWLAVSLKSNGDFIGFIGMGTLEQSTFPVPFTPAVEVGWRLAQQYWGKGYATEGALACLEYGFNILKLPEIIAFTALSNQRSRNVMEKIGMHRDAQDDFDHPKLPSAHPLCRHVLYRLKNDEWQEKRFY